MWNRVRSPVRKIAGFYSRQDLERIKNQNENTINKGPVQVNTSIVDRPRNIENVKRVVEHLQQGHRKGLIVMATGTGKTRVAMGIIDILLKDHMIQKVLFLTDRIALRDQAWDKGYLPFFPEEAKAKILFGKFPQDKRLYVSTIQTFIEIFQQKDEDGRYRMSPGEFDLIFSDEAHRSIYNKWRDVFKYFDAVQIGLTATPADLVERDTFSFFDCEENTPTALYSYADAVRDGVLCNCKNSILSAKTKFQIQGLKPVDLTPKDRKELLEKGVDPDDIKFEGTDLEKKVALSGTSRAIINEFMENCIKDETGTLPAKSIIFAISKKHAYRLQAAFDKLYPSYNGTMARVIESDDPRVDTLIHQFTNESLPRIAISIDMLDTGIDVPEVSNLILAKPVFSKIKFWQMIGRGTRSDSACEHKEWLPDNQKIYFRIFDFWENFEYFKMKPEGEKPGESEAIPIKIFLERLKQYEIVSKRGEIDKELELKRIIIEDVKSLPIDNISIKPYRQTVDLVISGKLWDTVGLDPMKVLKQEIMPLMKYQSLSYPAVGSFTLKTERAATAVLTQDKKSTGVLKDEIGGMVHRLPRTLEPIQPHIPLLDTVISRSFWEHPSYEILRNLVNNVSPLMKYIRKDGHETIIIDMGDSVKQWRCHSIAEEMPEYEIQYRERILGKIDEMMTSSPVIEKIRNESVLKEEDIQQLEEMLLYFDLKTPPHLKSRMLDMIRSVLMIREGQGKEREVREIFERYIQEHQAGYTANQIAFIRTLMTVFLSRHHIEKKNLFDPPFTSHGAQVPFSLFSPEQVNNIIGLCNGIEDNMFKEGKK